MPPRAPCYDAARACAEIKTCGRADGHGPAAILDVCLRLKLAGPQARDAGKARLDRIMSMLVKLAKSLGE